MMTPNAERLADALIESGVMYRFGLDDGPDGALVSCGVQDMVDVSDKLNQAAGILARSPDPAHRAAVAESTRLQQALSDMTGRYEALLRDHHPTYSVDNTPLGRRKWIAAEFERLTDDLGTVEADIGDGDGKAYSWLIVAKSRARALSDLWLSIYPEIQKSGCLDSAKGTAWEGASLVTQLRSYPAVPPGADAMGVSYPAGLMVQAADQIEALQVALLAANTAAMAATKPPGDTAAVGFLNVYRDDDGDLVTGSGDLYDSAAEAEKWNAAKFSDHVGVFALVPAGTEAAGPVDWAGASGLTWNSPLELPPEAGRGLAGQVMDAAWPEFGGNNAPADFWHAFALAVRFTIEATKPPGSGMNPEGERLYRAAMARTLGSLPDPDRTPAALADCVRFLEAWVPDTFPATDAGQIPFGRALLESAIDSMRAALTGSPTYTAAQAPADDAIVRHLTEHRPGVARDGDFVGLSFELCAEAEEFAHLMGKLPPATPAGEA